MSLKNEIVNVISLIPNETFSVNWIIIVNYIYITHSKSIVQTGETDLNVNVFMLLKSFTTMNK
jgi:hypothetical protein